MFDTHCHLYISPLYENIDKIILKSRESNILYLLVPGVDNKTSLKSVEISNCFENVFSAVGIHPTTVIEKENIDKSLYKIEELLQKENVLAVGEIGLDYYHKDNSESVQKELLEKQLQLAIKYNKAVIIHSRHTSDEIISVINDFDLKSFDKSLVFHCCEPSKELLSFCIKNNFYIGVDGDITFDTQKQNFIKQVPMENLVLETDSPYLAPTDNGLKDRDKINYPFYLPQVAQKVAEVKNISLEKLINITTKNALLLFGVSSGYNK